MFLNKDFVTFNGFQTGTLAISLIYFLLSMQLPLHLTFLCHFEIISLSLSKMLFVIRCFVTFFSLQCIRIATIDHADGRFILWGGKISVSGKVRKWRLRLHQRARPAPRGNWRRGNSFPFDSRPRPNAKTATDHVVCKRGGLIAFSPVLQRCYISQRRLIRGKSQYLTKFHFARLFLWRIPVFFCLPFELAPVAAYITNAFFPAI